MTMSSTSFDTILRGFPKELLRKLEDSYKEIKKNFREGRFEPSELNAGKFCEVVYRILEWHTTCSYTPLGARISNFDNSVKKFETLTRFNDSIRFHIPKILTAIYDIRNKRGVGHVGGDVNPNVMDSTFVVSGCDWIMAELVRIFHKVTTEEANRIVQGLVEKKIPLIWEVQGKKRVLEPSLTYRNKVLAILYEEYPASVGEFKLREWVEHSNQTVFRRKVVLPLHKEKLIEYNSSTKKITISPRGLIYVEKNVPLEI
jgi:hypothetical protein